MTNELRDLLFAQVLHADSFTPPVDVRGLQDGVFVLEGRNAEFDARVAVREMGEGWRAKQ